MGKILLDSLPGTGNVLPMARTNTFWLRVLKVLTQALCHAALMRSRVYRDNPTAAAHLAREHAEAAVTESRITQRSKG